MKRAGGRPPDSAILVIAAGAVILLYGIFYAAYLISRYTSLIPK
jgi:hypothetical protein